MMRGIKELTYPFHYAVTATTRPRRRGEKDGEDYHFLSNTEFERMKAQGELLEWAEVYGQWYGVPRSQVEQPLSQKQDVILRVDVQGAVTLKHLFPEAVLIFLAPPSTRELTQRLKKRNTESRADFELRLKTAQREMESLPLFDYVVVNHEGEVESAVSQINAIITAEKCRVTPRLKESASNL